MKRFVLVKNPLFVAVWWLLTPLCLMAQEAVVLDLRQALEIALSENPTVKVSQREIEKKKYARKGAYAALFPQVTFSGDYSRTLKKQVMYMDGFDMGSLGGSEGSENSEAMAGMSGGIEIGRDNNWSLGFTAGMPLINASLWKSLSISGLDVELAVEQARSSKINMENEVRKSFYGVLLAREAFQVFKESYRNVLQNYQDIEKKYSRGLVAEYDLIRADVAVKNTEPNMLQAENALALAKWQLKALLGLELNMEIECAGSLDDYQNKLLGDYLLTDTTLESNSTLRQLDIQSAQLRNTLSTQKLNYLPTLSLTGLYQWTSMNNDFKISNYQWNPYSILGVTLSIPIFTGGSRYHNVKQTQVSIAQLQLQQEDARRNLQLVVKQYTDQMQTCVKRFYAAQKGMDQAKRGYEIAKKRYDTGAGTLLEVNDAELATVQAKLNFKQSVYDYMVAKSEMDKTLGKQTY